MTEPDENRENMVVAVVGRCTLNQRPLEASPTRAQSGVDEYVCVTQTQTQTRNETQIVTQTETETQTETHTDIVTDIVPVTEAETVTETDCD